MKVQIRKGAGFYGHMVGGLIRPKNHASGAFTVPDNVGRNLIARGIADAVVDVPEPATAALVAAAKEETPAPAATPSKGKAKAKAAKATTKKAKRKPLTDSPTDTTSDNEPAPAFNAVGSVE